MSTVATGSSRFRPTADQEFHYQFGRFRLCARSRVLLKDGARVALTAKAMELLLVLLERRGETVTKEELRMAVWGSSAVVEENNLNQCISAIRKALGEARGQYEYVLTVTGIGYRFVAAVTECHPGGPRAPGIAAGRRNRGGRRHCQKVAVYGRACDCRAGRDRDLPIMGAPSFDQFV